MDASVTSSVIAGIGVILTAWLGFMGSRKGTLASAEKEFRETIMSDNENLRKRIEGLEKELKEVKLENHRMTVAMIRLEELTGQKIESILADDKGDLSQS